MPEVGLEPTCPCGREILSLVRIPISPLRLDVDDRGWREGASTGVRRGGAVPLMAHARGGRGLAFGPDHAGPPGNSSG